ncbi:MtnX-like HAD-IB family phosphatase [Chloroflexota bacterium]
MNRIAILSDFDGTITPLNVLDSLYTKFAGPSHKFHMERWTRGEISTKEEMKRIFETVKASRDEMESYLCTFELDPGFIPLLGFCEQRNYPFAIVSDGLRWYIDYILGYYAVEGVRVFASEIHFEDGFRFEYPWYDPAYPKRSTAKPLVIEDYQSRGYQVVFVGDGLSDVEAAGSADLVYAKDVLLRITRQRGIVAKEFDNLGDIIEDLKRL